MKRAGCRIPAKAQEPEGSAEKAGSKGQVPESTGKSGTRRGKAGKGPGETGQDRGKTGSEEAGACKKAVREPTEAWFYLHNKIHEVEHENVGVEGAHKSELVAEAETRN